MANGSQVAAALQRTGDAAHRQPTDGEVERCGMNFSPHFVQPPRHVQRAGGIVCWSRRTRRQGFDELRRSASICIVLTSAQVRREMPGLFRGPAPCRCRTAGL